MRVKIVAELAGRAKRRAVRWARVGCAGLVVGMSAGHAAEVVVPFELRSGYVFRGETRHDGAVGQGAVEIHGLPIGDATLPLTLGVWGNFTLADDERRRPSGEFTEIDLYVTLDAPLPLKGWRGHLGYWEYLFPGAVSWRANARDRSVTVNMEANRELSLGLLGNLPPYPEIIAYYGVGGAVDSDLYLEAGVSHEPRLAGDFRLPLSLRLGYLRAGNGGPSGFHSLSLSAGCRWRMLSAGLDYCLALDHEVLPDLSDGGAYDVKLVGRVGCDYRF